MKNMKTAALVLSLTFGCLVGEEMKIPDRWQLPKSLAGRDYRVALAPRKDVIDDSSKMAMPLFRDAIWFFGRSNRQRIDFLGRLMKDPNSDAGLALRKTSNPVLLSTNCFYTETEKDVAIPDSSWQAFKKTAGDRLLGTFNAEAVQSYDASQKRYKLPDPKSRQEAYEILRGTWSCKTMSQFRDFSVFYDWGLPRYSGTATYFDHMLMEFGSKCAGHECGCGITDMPMQFAVSRGAARQYGTFFYCYVATHERYLRYPGQQEIDNSRIYSHRDYNYLTPKERRVYHLPPRLSGYKPKPWHVFVTRGPECGIPDSEYRRRYIFAFMGGAGLYVGESARLFMYALYDWKTIGNDDPLVVNLRDRKYYLSKTGAMFADFYARIASKIDRGVVCTPVALVWDRYHGYGPNYAYVPNPLPWNGRFPQPGDQMFHSLESYLFPMSPRTHETKCHRTSPFGDIFDVITNDASQEAMDAYPALLLTGDVSMEHSGFGQRLVQYLKNGGTVIASRCQLKGIPELPEIAKKDGVQEIPFGKGKLIVSAQDYWLKDGKISNDLGDVIRKIADEQLPVKVTGDVQYLVNRTRDGVIVSLFNNYGGAVHRTWENPDPGLDPKETQKVIITLKTPASAVIELLNGKKLSAANGRIETSVAGCDVQLIRITYGKPE